MIFLYINGRSRFCRQHLALSWRSTFYLHICQIELNSLGASQYKWWHSNNQKAVDSFKSQRHESYWQLQVTKRWILLTASIHKDMTLIDSFKSQRHESYWQLQVTKTWILLRNISWKLVYILKMRIWIDAYLHIHSISRNSSFLRLLKLA